LAKAYIPFLIHLYVCVRVCVCARVAVCVQLWCIKGGMVRVEPATRWSR